ncbi:MAG: hypothetical protein AB1427_03610, partial [Thermodesulfobacteriota bacterium]
MGKIDNKKQKPASLKRYWPGLTCIFLIILSWIIATHPTIKPSSGFGGFVFFASVSEGSSFRISKAPRVFRVFVTNGKQLDYYKRDGQSPGNYPYPATIEGIDIVIEGLVPIISENEIKNLWTEEPFISVDKNNDGSFTVTYARDSISQIIKGVYKVKGNVVTEHYYEHQHPIIAMGMTFIILILYFLIVIIRSI